MQLQSSDLRSLCIDDVLLQPVDIVITRILRPHWHKVPVKAKQLVGELCTLRTLIKSLLKNDCVRWRRRGCVARLQSAHTLLRFYEALVMCRDMASRQAQQASHTSHVTRHTSHVTRHTSHVTRHTSHVTRHTSHVTPLFLK